MKCYGLLFTLLAPLQVVLARVFLCADTLDKGMYGLKLTTAPVTDPVSTATLKTFLRLNTSSEDTLLSGFISTATDLFQQQTNRQLMSATYTLYMDSFPSVIRLPRAPLTAVTHVKYYDTNDTLTTWSADNYSVDLRREPGRIVPSNHYFPTLTILRSPRIEIEFVAGYATSDAVPAAIKQAIMLLAAHFFENRSQTTDKQLANLPVGWQSVVSLYKLGFISDMNGDDVE